MPLPCSGTLQRAHCSREVWYKVVNPNYQFMQAASLIPLRVPTSRTNARSSSATV